MNPNTDMPGDGELEAGFEDRLHGLMDYRVPRTTPFSASDVAAAAHRRTRIRALGTTASAIAVTAVGLGVVTLAGGGPAPERSAGAAGGGPAATSTQSPATWAAPAATSLATSVAPAPATSSAPARTTSPVTSLTSGQKITVTPGFTFWVTSTQKCDAAGSPFGGVPAGGTPIEDCRDSTSDNLDHSKPEIYTQGTGTKTTNVLDGMYLGSTVPSLLDVVQGGKHYAATIVTTAGQQGWVGWYAVLPADATPKATPTTGNSQTTFMGTSWTITAYDAAGNVLAATPGF